MVYEKRKRRRLKLRFENNKKNVAGLGIVTVVREARGRDNWRMVLRQIVSTIHQFSDGDAEI